MPCQICPPPPRCPQPMVRVPIPWQPGTATAYGSAVVEFLLERRRRRFEAGGRPYEELARAVSPGRTPSIADTLRLGRQNRFRWWQLMLPFVSARASVLSRWVSTDSNPSDITAC